MNKRKFSSIIALCVILLICLSTMVFAAEHSYTSTASFSTKLTGQYRDYKYKNIGYKYKNATCSVANASFDVEIWASDYKSGIVYYRGSVNNNPAKTATGVYWGNTINGAGSTQFTVDGRFDFFANNNAGKQISLGQIIMHSHNN